MLGLNNPRYPHTDRDSHTRHTYTNRHTDSFWRYRGWQGEQGHAFAPSVRLTFEAPTSGIVYLKIYNDDTTRFGEDVTYDLSVRELEEETPADQYHPSLSLHPRARVSSSLPIA